MSNIKVSVIVPIYNTEKYLDKCLNSLVNQTLKEIEIILVDDCSTDNSSKVYLKYIEKHENIKLIKNDKNLGVSESRNKGIDLSIGEFIGFVDSDDYIDFCMYEKLYKQCIENESDISMCGIVEIYSNNQKFIGNNLNCTLSKKEEIIESFFKFDILAYSCNKLFKSILIKQNKIYYPNVKFGEDQYVTFVCLYYSNKVSLISESIYFYNKRERYISNINYFNKKLDIFDVIKNIEKFMIREDIIDKYYQLYQFRYIYVIFGNIVQELLDEKSIGFSFKKYFLKKIYEKMETLLKNYKFNKILNNKMKLKIAIFTKLRHIYILIYSFK